MMRMLRMATIMPMMPFPTSRMELVSLRERRHCHVAQCVNSTSQEAMMHVDQKYCYGNMTDPAGEPGKQTAAAGLFRWMRNQTTALHVPRLMLRCIALSQLTCLLLSTI